VAVTAAFAIILTGLTTHAAGPPAGPPGAGRTLALRGGRIMTASHGVLEGGIVLIKDGRIAAVGSGIPVPNGAETIDLSGLYVCPGFFDAFTNIGTADLAASERDDDEATDPLTPHLDVLDSFNPGNSRLPQARRFGILYALCAPGRGNLLAGQSAVVRLGGGESRSMAVVPRAAAHANLGEGPKLRYGARNIFPSTRMGQAALLRQTLIEAREYVEARKAYDLKAGPGAEGRGLSSDREGERLAPPASNARLEALVPVLKREMPLVVTANRMDDILTALRIADEFKLRLVLNEGAEAAQVKDRLASRAVPVLLRPRAAYRLTPETEGAGFEAAAQLVRAGVRIAFQTGEIQNIGDLLLMAQQAIAAGLREDEALRALTLWPSEIFGVADRIGSIAEGRAADLVVFDKNPLRSAARVRLILLGGEIVDRPD